MSAHTPTPYIVDAGFLCWIPPNKVPSPMYELRRIVGGDEAEDEATQQLIARACSAHAALVKALELARADFVKLCCGDEARFTKTEHGKQIDAALALAKEGVA